MTKEAALALARRNYTDIIMKNKADTPSVLIALDFWETVISALDGMGDENEKS